MVRPSRCRSLIRSKIRSATTGASPIDGSSNIKSRGEDAIPRPIASICCSPPESVPAGWPRRSARIGNSAKMRSRLRLQLLRPLRREAATSRFSITVIEPKTWRPSGTCAMPKCARWDGATASRSLSSKWMRPPFGRTVPEIALNSVVLPAPLGPTMDTNWPPRTLSEISQSAVRPPYATVRDSTVSTDRRPFLAEVGLDDARVVDDLAPLADRQYPTVVEHDEALGEPHHGAHRMLDNHDSDAPGGERADHREQVLDLLAGETGERLGPQAEGRAPPPRAGEHPSGG